jgi:hypothetical protein
MSNPDNKKPVAEAPAANTNPYPLSRLAPKFELVDLAKQIADADTMVDARVGAQLQVIAEQIRALQHQARSVLEKARQDQALNHAECTFKRIPGKVYHLYRRANGRCYFSMLSPEDWTQQPPHPFVASYRLERDLSWTPLEDAKAADDGADLVRRLLGESSR